MFAFALNRRVTRRWGGTGGFAFVLVTAVLGVAGALLMADLRLKEKAPAYAPPAGGVVSDEVSAGASAGLPREPCGEGPGSGIKSGDKRQGGGAG